MKKPHIWFRELSLLGKTTAIASALLLTFGAVNVAAQPEAQVTTKPTAPQSAAVQAPTPTQPSPPARSAPAPRPSPAPPTDCPNGTYVNTAGNTICSPYASPGQPAGATAQCVDGSYSFSQSHRGTCSHHGGVATWL